MDDAAIAQMIEKIIVAMNDPSCRMVSSTILLGNLCAGDKDILCPSNIEPLQEMLEAKSLVFTGHLHAVTYANYIVWSVTEDVREEFFPKDEHDVGVLTSIIAAGGMEWYSRVKSSEVGRAELSSFFQFIRELFIFCARNGEQQHKHPQYEEILEALNGISNIV